MLHIETIEGVEPLDTQIGVFPKKTVPDALHDALFGQPDPTAAVVEAAGGDAALPIQTYAILEAAKVATSRNASRGPLILRSNNASLPSAISSKVTVIGGAISRNLAAVLQQAENSPVPATDSGIRNQSLANVSPVNLGMTTKGNRKIVPIYLEADYINVESGDRLRNTTQYTANLPAAHTRWGIPPEPAQADKKAGWLEAHKRRVLPALPVGHGMFDKAAESIASTLLMNVNHRIC